MATSTWPEWVYCYVVLCLGAPHGSVGSGYGLKRLRRWFEVLSNRLLEPGIELRTPGYTATCLLTQLFFCVCLFCCFKSQVNS